MSKAHFKIKYRLHFEGIYNMFLQANSFLKNSCDWPQSLEQKTQELS